MRFFRGLQPRKSGNHFNSDPVSKTDFESETLKILYNNVTLK
jgi:hypothetical protein